MQKNEPIRTEQSPGPTGSRDPGIRPRFTDETDCGESPSGALHPTPRNSFAAPDHGAQEALHPGGSRSCASQELPGQSTPVARRLAGQCKHGQSATSANAAFPANAPLHQTAQNVIIELQYKPTSGKADGAPSQRSCFLGWTGMPSKRKLAPVVGRDGINSGFSREQEISTVELDTTFGRLLGLAEGQKVRATSIQLDSAHVGY